MARAYKCDRCGIYYHELKDGNKIEVEGAWDPVNDYTKYDICNKCREDFMRFMEEGSTRYMDTNELAVDYGTTGNDYCCEP